MKIAYILALLSLIAAAVLGWMNREKQNERRRHKDELARQILINFRDTETVNTEASAVIDDYGLKSDSLNMELNEIKKLTKQIDELITKIKATKEDTDRTTEEQARIEKEIKDLLGEFGRPEEITAKREEMIKELEEKKKDLEVATKELEMTKGIVAENRKLIAKLEEVQSQRKLVVSLESRQGTISAVNPDWAFVIINMGKNQGVSATTRLLVKRGGVLVGKLNPIQVDGNLTVADIDQKSVKAGSTILPGDQVVFEN